jgi:pantoate--beta-alanine ligase
MLRELPPIAATVAEARAAVAAARANRLTVGFVPTMGALHTGHATLIRAARLASGFVVVSVFVNPTQFGPNEDFAEYPRALDADRRQSADAGADLVFAPAAEEMYPPGAVTFVDVDKLGDHLCGPSRPGHFRGVCTVVLKLLNIVQPDLAYFGAKDAQQARIVRRMVRDLNVPVEVRVEPTVREPDGLAMSSRNRYLAPGERAAAPGLYRALSEVRAMAVAGERDAGRLEVELRDRLEAIPGARIDYASIVDDDSLEPINRLERPALAAVAVFLGTTRLIDNVTIP